MVSVLIQPHSLGGHPLAIGTEQIGKLLQLRRNGHRAQVDHGHTVGLTAGIGHHTVHHQMSQNTLDSQIASAVDKRCRRIGASQLAGHLQLGRAAFQLGLHTGGQVAVIGRRTHN